MSATERSRLGWLHLARPRENWHGLGRAEQDHMDEQFAGIRTATAADGVDVFGPYLTEGYGEWSRFVYFEFSDLPSLFRLEERLQAIDYMNFVDFRNHVGRVYSGPERTGRGQQPFAVAVLAHHDDAWYSFSREERQRIEDEEIVPSLGPALAGGNFIALNSCDITIGPQQFLLWEAPTLEGIHHARPAWNTFWRYHRGTQMIIGRRSDR